MHAGSAVGSLQLRFKFRRENKAPFGDFGEFMKIFLLGGVGETVDSSSFFFTSRIDDVQGDMIDEKRQVSDISSRAFSAIPC